MFGLGFLLTIGDYKVPETVDQNTSLPGITIDGYTYYGEAFGDPSDPVLITLHGGPGTEESWRFGAAAAESNQRDAFDSRENINIDLTVGVENFTKAVLFMAGECIAAR